MALSWNEIKDRALRFTKEWEGESRERAEKDTFWNDFFNVFGISRRRLATYEETVKKLNNKQFIFIRLVFELPAFASNSPFLYFWLFMTQRCKNYLHSLSPFLGSEFYLCFAPPCLLPNRYLQGS
mgnify:CR=1 FL=1